VILVGRLASDPELRYTPSGSAVAQLRLATNEGSEPEFHQLSAWGKVAEFAGFLFLATQNGRPANDAPRPGLREVRRRMRAIRLASEVGCSSASLYRWWAAFAAGGI
jgi:hypothetical protein